MKPCLIVSVLLFFIYACKDAKQTGATQKPNTSIENSLTTSIARGKVLYQDFCAQCHLPNGKGISGNFPPLAGSDWFSTQRVNTITAVKYGLSGPIVVNGVEYNGVMASQGLSNQEIVDVLNYCMSSWGNTQQTPITLEEVQAIKKNP